LRNHAPERLVTRMSVFPGIARGLAPLAGVMGRFWNPEVREKVSKLHRTVH
jgi:hypothetical protein